MAMRKPFDIAEFQARVNRRTFLSRTGLGMGSIALAGLLPAGLVRAAAVTRNGTSSTGGRWRGAVNPLDFPGRAKRVIHLCMAGGPSHLETFDNKPKLLEMAGKPFGPYQ